MRSGGCTEPLARAHTRPFRLIGAFVVIVGLAISVTVACGEQLTDSPSARATSTPLLASFGHTFEARPDVTTAASIDTRYTPTLMVGHPDPLDLADSEIVVGGNSDFGPITRRLASSFHANGFVGQVSLNQSSTEAGIAQFCGDRAIDLILVTRELTEPELDSCASGSRDPITISLGADRMAFAVSEQNFWLQELSSSDLGVVLSERPAWSELDSTFSSRSIVRYLPTPDREVAAVVATYLADTQGYVDDLVSIDGASASHFVLDANLIGQLARDPDGIGFVSVGAFTNLGQPGLRLLPLNGAEPDGTGSYPIVRPVYLVADRSALQERVEVATFVGFVLNRFSSEARRGGFAPLHFRDADQAIARFVAMMRSVEASTGAVPQFTTLRAR